MFLLAATAISATIALLLTLDERAQVAPDSEYYLAMAKGNRAPKPFCYRWLLPIFLGAKPESWKLATLASVVLQGVAIALITSDLRAPVLLLALPGGARISLRYPVLVDAVAMAAVLGAWLFMRWLDASPWLVVLTLVVFGNWLGSLRESAAVWFGVYVGSALPLLGLVPAMLVGWVQYGRRTDATLDNEFIRAPFIACTTLRVGQFFDWRRMLLAWGVLLPLALAADWRMALIYVGLSAIPLLIATDTARIQYWAAPALIPLALLAPIPDAWWPVLLAAHVFNPYRGA